MSKPALGWSLHEKIPSSLDVGHATIERLMAALEANHWEGRDLFHIQLAIEEAIVNAITHGNKLADDKVVEVEFRVDPQTTFMRIKDQGAGFNPADIPDPTDDDHLECTNGRGVMLIREFMSEVRYNDRGNEVTMIKHRSKEDAKDEE
jgi:serine/threonine-protein kinase RsbW